jgi:uncharacterized RDD family membrane protein YckC
VPAPGAPGQYGAPDPYGAPAPADAYGVPAQQGYGLPYQDVPAYASWIKRVAAYLIDSLVSTVAQLPALIGYILWLVRATPDATTDPVTGEITSMAGPSGLEIGIIAAGVVLSLAVTFWNVVIRQGRTGQTLGKSALGITLIGDQTRQPIGAGASFLRQLAHIIDGLVCYLGFLWPLWDAKRQTFADKIMNTIVVEKN